MKSLTLVAAAAALSFALDGCAQSDVARYPTLVRPTASVHVSGQVHGVSFRFTCTKLSSSHAHHTAAGASAAAAAEDDSAFYGDDGPDAWVSCHDAALGISANTHVARLEVGSFSPVKTDEHAGRIGIVVERQSQPGDSKNDRFPEIISTESIGNGSIVITEWDETSRHLVGSSTMSWERDSSGRSGFVKVEYELSPRIESVASTGAASAASWVPINGAID